MAYLQTLLADFMYESLPPAWTTGDLASFSRGKTLWSYQQDALRKAVIALWLYYDGDCLLYTSPSPRDRTRSRMPSSA